VAPVAGARIPAGEATGEFVVAEDGAAAIDVVFGVAGTTLPADHAYALRGAVLRFLPWLDAESGAGIHRLRAAPTGYGVVLLAQRAKLTLRVPRRRLGDALALAGRTLSVAGSELAVGAGSPRPLAPWGTLHAQQVAMEEGGLETAFQDEVGAWLRTRGIVCDFITGRRRILAVAEGEIVGFSVALHGLSPAASLRVQCEGMGRGRALGCGIFVPHKSIAALA
jgi:CRISPR-associated protein Cas6